jgi:hypothetical protein
MTPYQFQKLFSSERDEMIIKQSKLDRMEKIVVVYFKVQQHIYFKRMKKATKSTN